MQETSIYQERKDVFSNIAGQWYAESIDQKMVFGGSERLSQEAALSITSKGKQPHEDVYSISSYLGDDNKPIFYIDIGQSWDTRRWFKIKEISAGKMVLVEMEKAIGRKETGGEVVYVKRAK